MGVERTLNRHGSGLMNTQALDDNADLLESGLAETLSRDDPSDNAMGVTLDMNNNDVINAGLVDAQQMKINGVDVDLSLGQPVWQVRNFVSTMLFDFNLFYNDFAQSGALSITLDSSPVNGVQQILKIITDGSGVSFSADFIDGVDGSPVNITELASPGTIFLQFLYSAAQGKVLVKKYE